MMEAKSVRNMYSITAVTNKHTAKLHHVGSLCILYINTIISFPAFPRVSIPQISVHFLFLSYKDVELQMDKYEL